MAYEVIHTAPQASDFTPLSAHQAQTPGTFFGGKAVLHYHCADTKVQIRQEELAPHADFAALGDAQTSQGDDGEIGGVDVWVTSSLHAEDGDAVLLQLGLSDPNTTADEDFEAITLRIIPNAESSVGHDDASEPNGSALTPRQQLYEAISAGQELNPDADPDDEGENGFDETAPGATGWITSENMADFVDEDGNFRMPEGTTVLGGEEHENVEHANGLGPGAGTTRTAAEVDAEDGAEDDGKWQRTG
ncbi:hypothetical protein LTR97_009488 [Elasticomyces elasticus]|uniref:Protein LOT5 n=1 Tax=Elasticomyces elasticus TaxID=574655 RepID=A0AAN7W3P6_9PEZI|nr:hypothetical protein LTR97_009488 [Elasticomyces elasticus]